MACALAGCGPRRPALAPDEAVPPKPRAAIETTVKGLRLTGHDKLGRKSYEVRTRSTSQSELAARATLTDTVITLYHEGQPDVVIHAPKARIDGKTKDVVMWGGLDAKAAPEKAAFRVDRMTWNSDTRRFLGTGHVVFTQGSVTFWADNLAGTTPLKSAQLGDSVRFEVRQPAR